MNELLSMLGAINSVLLSVPPEHEKPSRHRLFLLSSLVRASQMKPLGQVIRAEGARQSSPTGQSSGAVLPLLQ